MRSTPCTRRQGKGSSESVSYHARADRVLERLQNQEEEDHPELQRRPETGVTLSVLTVENQDMWLQSVHFQGNLWQSANVIFVEKWDTRLAIALIKARWRRSIL